MFDFFVGLLMLQKVSNRRSVGHSELVADDQGTDTDADGLMFIQLPPFDQNSLVNYRAAPLTFLH